MNRTLFESTETGAFISYNYKMTKKIPLQLDLSSNNSHAIAYFMLGASLILDKVTINT